MSAPSTAPLEPGASPPSPSGSSAPPVPGTPPTGSVPPILTPPTNEHHGPPLPELSVKSFGLHIGGSKDTGAREEFLHALEGGSWRYLDCYRSLEQPGAVGTFGADLTLGAAGGKAKVKATRTKLHGEAFETCMVRAFESVSFGRPPSGRSVVVSYSVKFSFSD